MTIISTGTTVNPFSSIFDLSAPQSTNTSPSAPANTSSTSTTTSTSSTSTSATATQAPIDLLVSNARLATSGSTGALLAGGTNISLLGQSLNDDSTSIFGTLPTQNSTIYNQITQTAIKRFTDMKQVITDSAAQQTALVDAQNTAWITIKSQINNADAAVTTGQDSISRVSDDLLTLRGSVDLAGTNGEDIKLRAGQFDDMINAINDEADSGGNNSLVGNINRVDFSPNQVSYQSDAGLGQHTLNGTYIGTDYRITADDGTVWVPDPGSDTITHYSELQGVEQTITTGGITLPDSTSTRTGLKLDSYDPKTNKITFEVTVNPEDPPRVISGTLQRTGIGVMQSWFYDGLTTAAGRQRAYDDISASEGVLGSAGATLQVAANTVNTDKNHADAALADLTQQTVKINNDELVKEQDLQTKSTNQLSALQANLSSLQSTQTNYLNLLSSAVDDPLSQSLINISV